MPSRRPESDQARPTRRDPYRWHALAVACVFGLTLPVIAVVTMALQPQPVQNPWASAAAELGVTSLDLAFGEETYRNSCAVCHGDDGEGVPRLGKPLRNSAFVQGHSDGELFRLIVDGRTTSDPANTTGALMPARGAQGLSDEAIGRVVAYLRMMQASDEPVVSVSAWDLKDAQGDGAVAAGAAVEIVGHPGHELFIASCAACHGEGAEGMEGLGLPLTTSGFVRGMSDKDLITFIKSGRPIWDENNTTGLDMPPKGGNPAITDAQLQTITDYLRALQAEALGS